ncbi:MAG: hypothetical protein PHS37_03170 [Candidatus Omnitrophica bacterium]|nr:hypothetical protein [Candidatus Omnitrophota bacterium]
MLTRETIKVLSAIVREQLFGRGVICLEGPTGTGKTFIAEGFSKLTSVDEAGKYKKRMFYCEPIHGTFKIDKWLGYYAVDQWGNYPFNSKTEFKAALSSGGVIAASELNAKVDADSHAALGYWLIPKARGDSQVLLTEYPRANQIGQYSIPCMTLHKQSLVVVDINPQESYAARGELPDFLKAYIPTVYVSGNIPEPDLNKLASFFLKNKKSIDDAVKPEIAAFLAGVHRWLQEQIQRGKLGKGANAVLTIRELSRTAEDIARRVEAKEPVHEAVAGSLSTHYGYFWKNPEDRDRVRIFIEANIRKNFKAPVIRQHTFTSTAGQYLAPSEQVTLDVVQDSLMKAGRPTMLISPMDSRTDTIVSELTENGAIPSFSETMSIFTELFHLVGGFVPVNQDIGKDQAFRIIRRLLRINPERVNDVWTTRLGNEKKLDAAEALDAADERKLIVLATALNSLEAGEAWNAKLRWEEEILTRAVKKCWATKGRVLLVLKNYHRLRPKVAVALNELLQGRQLHLEDGSVLKLPPNLSILALSEDSFELPISPAEQSRWVRITGSALSEDEKSAITLRDVRRILAESAKPVFYDGEPLDKKSLGTLANDIAYRARREARLIRTICPKDDYYFSFWDDLAFARAIVGNIFERDFINSTDLDEAVAQEKLNIYGVALRKEEGRMYGGGTIGLPTGMHEFTSHNGVLKVGGISYDIADPRLEQDTKKDRLVELSRLAVTERAMLRAFKQGRFVVLEGPPGGGKTETAVDLFNRMGLENYLFSSHDRVHLSDFIGEYTQDETGNYMLTSLPDADGHYKVPFLEFFTHGGGFIVDEGAIGKRAQELIAWLGPLAAGAGELYLQEHPGAAVQRLVRHPNFHLVITTNPYRDTPGREALPFEVLGHAQKIWLDGDFTRSDFTRILINTMKNFDIPNYIKSGLIDRMINFHFSVERAIGKTLGAFHQERYYIGIRELTQWAGDIERIYRQLDTKNIEFAFIEALMQHYNIFSDQEEKSVFKWMVFRELLEKKLNQAILQIAETAKDRGQITMDPINSFIEAYQVLLEDDLMRTEVCNKIMTKLEEVLGYIPEFSLSQYFDLAERKSLELEEFYRQTHADYSITVSLAKLYAEEGNEGKALDMAKTALDAIEEELKNISDLTVSQHRADDQAMRWLSDASRTGVSVEVSMYGDAYLFLLALGTIYEKFNKTGELIRVVHAITTLAGAGIFTRNDLVYCLPYNAKDFFRLISLLPLAERVQESRRIDDFINKSYFDPDQAETDLTFAGLSMCAHFVYVTTRHSPQRTPDLVKNLIKRYLKKFRNTPQADHFRTDARYSLTHFWDVLIDAGEVLPDDVKQKVVGELEQEYDAKDDTGFSVYSRETRLELALALGRGYAMLGEYDKAESVLNDTIDLIRDLTGKLSAAKKLPNIIGEQDGQEVMSERVKKIEELFDVHDVPEFFVMTGRFMQARRDLLNIAYITKMMDADTRGRVMAKVSELIPPSSVNDVFRVTLAGRDRWLADTRLGPFCVNVLKKLETGPDVNEYALLDVLQNDIAPAEYLRRIEALIEKLPTGNDRDDMDDDVAKALIPGLLKAVELSKILPKEDIEKVAASVFHKMSYFSLHAVAGGISARNLLSFYKLLLFIKKMYSINADMARGVAEMSQFGAREITEVAQKFAHERRHLEFKKEDGTVKIGYMSLTKGVPLDATLVPQAEEWVDGIYSEETAVRFLANSFQSHRPSLFFCQPGSRPKVVIEKIARELAYELHPVNCYEGMSVMDLISGLSPVLGGRHNDKKKLAQERGLLSTHLVEEEKKSAVTTRKVLVFYNIDFLSERVRAALHNFLLKGFVYVQDDEGHRIKLVQPDGLHLVATMSSDSDREISDAFFNRFNRTDLPAFDISKRQFTELEMAVRKIYGVPINIARYIVRVVFGAMVLDTRLLWPSAMNYGFSIKYALILARYYTDAMREHRQRGDNIPDVTVLYQEAVRLFGGALSDTPDQAGQDDRSTFERLVLEATFPKAVRVPLEDTIVLDQKGMLREMNGVPVARRDTAQPLFEVDEKYRLSFVPTLMKTAASVLRAWQPAWMNRGKTRQMPNVVVMTGETGVAKTTLGINLALQMGMEPYVYSTHQGSQPYDLTADISPDGYGGYYTRVKDFARLAEQGGCVLVIDEGNIKSQLIQITAPITRGEERIQLVVPGDGLRLSTLLMHILGSHIDMETMLRRLRQYKHELFGDQERRFGALLKEFEAAEGEKEKERFLHNFFTFAESLRKSGPITITLGENVLILITQNPSEYAGRDRIDPAVVYDAVSVWASSMMERSEVEAMVDSFMGILNRSLTELVTILPVNVNGIRDIPPDAIRFPEFSPFQDEGTILDQVSVKLHGKAVKEKTALIQRDVAFFTSKNIVIVPAKGFAISADGKQMYVPYHQLLYSSPEVITGSIIHEIRHQRYTPSATDIDLLVDELLREQAVTVTQAESLRQLVKDPFMNMLFQLAENVRTDSIREPGYEGENDYLESFRQEQFLDNRIDRLPARKRAAFEAQLIEWARSFPNQAFVTELSNLGYFQKFSRMFDKYPAELQTAVRNVSQEFLFAAQTPEVQPDFEAIFTEQDFQKEKLRCFKEYLLRLAGQVIPAYAELVEKARPGYEKERKKAEAQAKEFMGYMEPYTAETRGPRGEKAMTSKTAARIENEFVKAMTRLERLLAHAAEIRKLTTAKTGIEKQHENLGKLRAVIIEMRDCIWQLAERGVPDQMLTKAKSIRAMAVDIFDDMIGVFREKAATIRQNYPPGSDFVKGLDDKANKRLAKMTSLIRECKKLADSMNDKITLPDLYAIRQRMETVQQSYDWLYIGVANCGITAEILEKVKHGHRQIQQYKDNVEDTIGRKQFMQAGSAVRKEMAAVTLIQNAGQFQQETQHWERVIESNPLPEQLIEAQQELAKALFGVQDMIAQASVAGLGREVIDKIYELRDKIVRILKETEKQTAILSLTKAADQEKIRGPASGEAGQAAPPAEGTEIVSAAPQGESVNKEGAEETPFSDEDKAMYDTLRAIHEAQDTAKKIGREAANKKDVNTLMNMLAFATKVLHEVQARNFELANSGASESLVDEGQKARDDVVAEIDAINAGIQAEAETMKEKQGQPVNPIVEELNKVREFVMQAQAAYEKLRAGKPQDVSLKDIMDEVEFINTCLGNIIVSVHRAAYLGAPDPVFQEMQASLQTVVRWSDDLMRQANGLMVIRAAESKEKITELLHGVFQEQTALIQEMQKISPADSIPKINVVEYRLIQFITTLNTKLKDMTVLGTEEKELTKVLVMRERLTRALFTIEKLLREKRLAALRGMSLGNLEALIEKVHRKCADTVLAFNKDTSLEDLEKGLKYLKENLATVIDLIGQMSMSGSNISVIRHAMTVRDDIAKLIDDTMLLIKVKLPAEPAAAAAAAATLAVATARAAKLWQDAQDLYKKADKKVDPDLLVMVYGLYEEINEVIEGMHRLKAGYEMTDKAKFSRKGIAEIADEICLALRDDVVQKARLAPKGGAEKPPALKDVKEIPEEKLEARLNEMLVNSQEIMKSIAGDPSAKNIRKGASALRKYVEGLDTMILQMSVMGGREDFVTRITDARSMVWTNLCEVVELMRKINQDKRTDAGGKTTGLKDALKQFRETAETIAESVTDTSTPDKLMPAANELMNILKESLDTLEAWNAVAWPTSQKTEQETVQEVTAVFDTVNALLREIIRAYQQMSPPSGMQGGGGGQGNGGSMGMDGDMFSAGEGMMGGAGAMGQGGAAGAGSAGGQEGSGGQGQTGASGAAGGAMGGSSGGAGKGAPARAALAPAQEGTEAESEPAPLDMPADTGNDSARAETQRDDTPLPGQGEKLDEFADDLVSDRLKEIRDKGLMGLRGGGVGRAAKDARQIINLFRQMDAQVEVDEAPTGTIVNVPRFIRGSSDPFDIEYEQLGNISLAMGLYVDNSGSIGAIKQYVADSCAYLIDIFNGIAGTRTGRDKYDYCIKTFDTGLNSFKDFGESLTKEEALSLPKNIESILGNGGTSINLSLQGILKDFDNVKEKTKVAIFITDGQDTVDTSLVREIEDKGIILIGIGIGSYSENVRHIFNRYLIFTNPKNQLPDAIVRLATQLSLGKKLPAGDLKDYLGVTVGDIGAVEYGRGQNTFYRNMFMRGHDAVYQALPNDMPVAAGSPLDIFSLVKFHENQANKKGVSPRSLKPLTKGRDGGTLSYHTILRDLGTLCRLGLVEKTGAGKRAVFSTHDFENNELETIRGVLEALGKRPSSLAITNGKKALSGIISKRIARGFVTTVLDRSRAIDEHEAGAIVIGIDTSWIPAVQRPFVQGLLSELEDLSGKHGIGNIKIVRNDDGQRLSDEIAAYCAEAGVAPANVIILGESRNLKRHREAFKALRKPDDGSRGAYFTEIVVPEDFPENGDIQLLKILQDSLGRAFSDSAGRWHVWSLTIEPYDLDVLKDMYEAQKEILSRA